MTEKRLFMWKRIALVVLSIGRALAETRALLDLSYKHHLEASSLAEAIKSQLNKNKEVVQWELDLTSSSLSDRGIVEIVTSLESLDVGESPRSIHFTASRNKIHPDGAIALIKSILKLANATSNETPVHIESLDLSWNHFPSTNANAKDLYKLLQKLVENPVACPKCISLQRCGLGPAACRSIGKGIIERYSEGKKRVPISLILCGNPNIGDAGAAAIAAAIRTIAGSDSEEDCVVIDRLDLSACDIGDPGAEALALALESSSACLIKHLDLSSNSIGDKGAIAIGRALAANLDSNVLGLHSLDLSGNNDVGDRGATAIADALSKSRVPQVIMRSCRIYADGAAAFARALRVFSSNKACRLPFIRLDLSGNPIGILRGKSNKDGGKYSASRLKSKASATAASYMNQGISFIRKGLKDVGVDVSPVLGSPAESDDEEEARNGQSQDSDPSDPSKGRCGAKAMASAFCGDEAEPAIFGDARGTTKSIEVSLRHCHFDHAGSDALASMLVAAKDEMHVNLSLDVELNPILEEDMVEALHGSPQYDDTLRSMAERHNDAMFIIQDAKQRAAEAAKAAQARARREAELESEWNAPSGLEQEYRSDDGWDSDADYDQDEL